MKVSDYGKGEIVKNQYSNYEYVVDGKVQGEYANIDLLVHDNPVTVQAAKTSAPAKKTTAKKASK